MNFWEKMMNLDRRWIYLCIAIVVVIPAVVTFKVPVATTPEVKKVYDFIEGMKPGEYFYLGIDYDPSNLAELDPMTYAILNQAFSKDLKIVIACLSQFGVGMAETRLAEIGGKYGKKSGEDYCFLGYRPYPGICILTMGVDFRITFPLDYYGVPLDSLPMMQGIKNLMDVKGVVDITGGNISDMWITYGNGRFGFPVALGLTGVMSADYYQYLQSGQVFGLIPGIKGAAEYETLSGFESTGIRSIPYQTLSHAVILFFIIISNVGYFATRGKKGR